MCLYGGVYNRYSTASTVALVASRQRLCFCCVSRYRWLDCAAIVYVTMSIGLLVSGIMIIVASPQEVKIDSDGNAHTSKLPRMTKYVISVARAGGLLSILFYL